MNDILDKLKRRLGIDSTDEDALLNDIIGDVKLYIYNFCNLNNVDDIPDTLSGVALDMAVIDYNRIGTEGLKSESYSGASYSYERYGNDIINALYRERLCGAR